MPEVPHPHHHQQQHEERPQKEKTSVDIHRHSLLHAPEQSGSHSQEHAEEGDKDLSLSDQVPFKQSTEHQQHPASGRQSVTSIPPPKTAKEVDDITGKQRNVPHLVAQVLIIKVKKFK